MSRSHSPWIRHLVCTPMGESHFTSLRNTDRGNVHADDDDEDSTLRKVLLDVERLVAMLTSEHEQNKCPVSSELVNFTGRQSIMAPSLSSTTMTSVTTNEDNGRLIEHLRHRVVRLERERHVLLTSYQLLINLLR